MTKRSFNHHSYNATPNPATARSGKNKHEKKPRVTQSPELPFSKVPKKRNNENANPTHPYEDAVTGEEILEELKSLPVSLETSAVVLNLYKRTILENHSAFGMFLDSLRSAINTEIQKTKITKAPIEKTMSDLIDEALHRYPQASFEK